ncbi:hypothetical protein HW115_05220 [Verrucomicrobiaceae bacterium N1E253]|uniref:Uncharacterized protein n=1 Tax=Oceaniferula marina TaxID=2748318 RepID=A0A851GB66_9BACT|nr:Wadjet anti-phage system protein JetA family protein [Oceaniferula marina]NWK54998.1 hypothetical protein [Oceaniferula marina]
MSTEHLSTALFRETRGPGFFRVLSGKNAAFYVDVLDELEQLTAEKPDGLAREEVIAVITDTLERHPGFEFIELEDESQDPSEASSPRDKARLLLHYLLKCHWLDEPPQRDWRKIIYFDAHGATLIQALRKIAWPDAAVFTDKLIGVCSMLADESSLSDTPWQTVENCIANVKDGLSELQSMQKSIQRFTRRQLEEETLKGNLSVVFDDYTEQMSHACYAEMVRSRLPLRLPAAVNRITKRLMSDASAFSDMQTEVLRRHPDMSAETARAMVGNTLDELITLIERVMPMADEIDRRTADFIRRSLARFRYLQDVTGERRGEVKAFFDTLNNRHAGKKITQVTQIDESFPAFRLPSASIPAGLDSLYKPPIKRPDLKQDSFDEAIEEGDREGALSDMGRALKESLSAHRANSYVKSLPGGKGICIASADLPLEGEAGFSDLISLLLHAESNGVRYRLEVDRVEQESIPPETDPLPGCSVERFTLIKK